MKKIIFAAVILMALVLVGAGCGSLYGTPSTSNTVTNTSPGTGIPVGGGLKAMQLVSIQNFSFNPAELSVEAGTTVRWTNNDSVSHQISGTGFLSQSLGQGESYTFTFDQAGTFDYHCAIHPSMTGKVIVTPGTGGVNNK